MRLARLWIEDFKNLRDFDLRFGDDSPYTVLVGENGSGKSNVLEAVTLIFRNLDLDLDAPFTYRLEYTCRDHDVEVDGAKGRRPTCRVKAVGVGEFLRISRREFMEEDDEGKPLYRPAFVFGYYSGPSDRLASLYDRHRDRYYNWIIKSRAQRKRGFGKDPNSLRRLFYAQTLHGQFALLAFFMKPDNGPDGDQAFLRDKLQIDSLDSVLFALKRPSWRRKGGNPAFWNAEGEVRKFLELLYTEALCPLRMKRRIVTELSRSSEVECLYLFLSSREALERVYRQYPDQYSFFTALESMHLSEVLSEVRTRVKMSTSGGGGEVTYRDLSEGEQQLLLVLGLLKFTARDEALFLLDEPDTHLNPVWSIEYLGFLDRFIRDRNSCHVVMTSHDPLVFAGLGREEVRILRRGERGRVLVEEPMLGPRGMGVAAILTSDMFGLRSTLDVDTQGMLDRQRRLSTKAELSSEEEEELGQLTEQLGELGFWMTSRDALYDLFVRKWHERMRESANVGVRLTAEQMSEQDEVAARIAAEIAEEIAAQRERQT